MISAALVGRDGSIDWLCLPRFDSPACFAALLGDRENGRWIIAPAGAHETRRSYYARTAVLETRFSTARGEAVLIDFMPLTDDERKVDVVRIVRGLRGERRLSNMELILRFAYGTAVPWVRRRDYGLSAIAGPDAVELHTRAPLEGPRPDDARRVHRARGRERAVHAVVPPVAQVAAFRARHAGEPEPDGHDVARMVEALPSSIAATSAGTRPSFAR